MTEIIEKPTPRLFGTKFRDSVRVGFNWERFVNESWPIELVTITSQADLQRCFMPWYIGKTGNEVAYDHADAAPMCMADVVKAVKILNDERQDDIQQYSDSFQRHGGLVEFTAPTYALPEDQYFVLDRNHRLSALTLASVPFKVVLWNVRGPLEPDCLLDLIHWQPNR